jgi:hypothetical protein
METSTVIDSASVVAEKNIRRMTKPIERKTMTNPVLLRLLAMLLSYA